ncbi:Peptidase, T4 family [hydrothermal vent metagenome]|uniref:Peptidase, T4 family n=1 Tax=hydrothermal vent metagenome TaxID=652676 RepID=A0A3B0THF7_9ZZZZ
MMSNKPFVAAVDVMGGAPGTRETDLLSPDKSVEAVDALVLSGGSAFGLDAPSGVVDILARRGRGFRVGDAIVPIVPGAILFDLVNGGNKKWDSNPYRALGAQAIAAASRKFELGSVGAGAGATTASLKGGLGSASIVLSNGITVGALVAANPTGQVNVANSAHFWAGAFEMGDEFGGFGPYPGRIDFTDTCRTKKDLIKQGANTTIAIVATDAKLSNAQAKRLAVGAQDGMGRAIVPSHTPVDGDLVFAVSTGMIELDDPLMDLAMLGHAASICLARAIARAIYHAKSYPDDVLPTWAGRFGRTSMEHGDSLK